MDDAEKDLGQEQSPVKDTNTAEGPEISLEEQPQVEEQKFTFEFTETEVNLILRGLGEIPLKFAYNFVGKIVTEIDKQKIPK